MNREERNKMIVENLPLVGYLVSEICARSPHLSREDLAGAGAVALVSAAHSFDPTYGVRFGTFARRRILGAFADDMRAADWASRDTRRRIKETLAVSELLTGELLRNPTVSEIAEVLGVGRDAVAATLADASRTVSALDENAPESLTAVMATPEESLLVSEQAQVLRAAVEALPEKMRYIIEQTYFEDRPVKDLAEEFGSTHSAVSQQRAEAIRLLRDGMAAVYSDTEGTAPAPESRVAPARRNAYLSSLAALTRGGSTLNPGARLAAMAPVSA
ncbi:sigma-70 family RNA polymerase sigma factor [Arthrobacter sp. TMN-37]